MTRCFDSDIREQIRSGQYVGHTAGLAPEYLQVNVVILPKQFAVDFLGFCQNNPKPCPVLAIGYAGDPSLHTLGRDIDVRRDIPRYCVYQDGEQVANPTEITDLWRQDLLTVAIGCSFTFEQSLLAHGITLKHLTQGRNVAMYDTNIALQSYGGFAGNMVVSMRPLTAKHAIKAIQITSHMPEVHGAPIHLGAGSDIGIDDMNAPDYGDPIAIAANELPVFWPCGVTPMAVLKQAKLPFFITHSPGCMLITEIPNHHYFH